MLHKLPREVQYLELRSTPGLELAVAFAGGRFRITHVLVETMSYEFAGTTIESDANGYLVNTDDWTPELAAHIAQTEGIAALTQDHMDVIEYLRDAYFNQGGEQPNTRTIIKAMSEKWGRSVSQKDLYDLFPLDPSKQGGRIAGLPESRRKGGY